MFMRKTCSAEACAYPGPTVGSPCTRPVLVVIAPDSTRTHRLPLCNEHIRQLSAALQRYLAGRAT